MIMCAMVIIDHLLYLTCSSTVIIIIIMLCRFDSVTDLLEPVTDGFEDQCFISKSYDATSHFETCANDVLSLYTRITGTELDMNISADMNDDES